MAPIKLLDRKDIPLGQKQSAAEREDDDEAVTARFLNSVESSHAKRCQWVARLASAFSSILRPDLRSSIH